MKALSIQRRASRREARPERFEALCKAFVLRRMRCLQSGHLEFVDGACALQFGEPADVAELRVRVEVKDHRFYRELAIGGSLGAGEAYMLGYWTCDDLTTLVRLLLVNRDTLEDMDGGAAWLSRLVQRVAHWFRRNSRSGSRRNIAAHYDLGNEFFSLWLDASLMYSCAVFERPEMSLAEAATAKLDRICQKLELAPGDRVLEIGTGWGGFALHAAARYGCHVTTTTLSREQYALARERVARAGLESRVELRLDDYRDLRGQYDKLVSIEMIEAVGHQYLDTYFGQCARLLRPDGMLLLQAITIADQRYEQARRTADFIKRHIFPGGFLPSVTALLSSVTRSSDLRMFHLEDIGPHYATTLRHWRAAFKGEDAAVRDQGYSEEFIRMWEYYLCYSEGAFLERAIGTVQMLLVKPGNRREPLVPSLQPEM